MAKLFERSEGEQAGEGAVQNVAKARIFRPARGNLTKTEVPEVILRPREAGRGRVNNVRYRM